MEALNAPCSTLVSVLSERRTEPKKISTLITSSSQHKLTKTSSSTSLSSKVNGGLAFLSTVFNAGLAKALTYEEALGLAGSGSSDFDVVSFVTDNPAVIIGGATLLAVPLVLSQLFKKPKPSGVESAKMAYAKLREVADAELLDIRTPKDVKAAGSPDIRGLKKKVVSVVYDSEDKPGFLKKLSLKFKEPENTTLFILDKFDGSSELVAELVTANGFKAAYAIKDGAEGPRGWTNSGLPWISPKKTLSFDFGNLAETFGDTLGEGAGALPVALGLAAASGLSLLAFTEIETILQLLGSAAIVQFVGKKLLYAEDRKATLRQVDEFLTTKIAPKELVGEIGQIGKALLPTVVENNALPAPVQETPDTAPPTTTELKAEELPESEPNAAVEPPQINSAPKTEVKEESLPRQTGSLSPYPMYPDLKPPSSPMPSPP